MNGKGIYTWILNRCENGDMAKVVARLQQAGMKPPTEKQIEQAWAEIQAIREQKEIEQARKELYEKETDHLLFEALMKLDLPELKEWQEAREQVKKSLPYQEVKHER
ncbi:MAG: hypothetical protein GX811_00125 [Lentisphaerae bacterium]|nr:hypothetical protein [Lentisphaerota bacterium]